MNFFFNGQFWEYGSDVLGMLKVSELPMENRTDPMAKIFPKMTKCTWSDYGASGTVQTKDGLCVLAINIINEKTYIFLWFWFLTIFVWTAIHLTMRVVSVASKFFRLTLLNQRTHGHSTSEIKTILRHFDSYGDWFLLMQLVKQFEPNLYHEFVHQLTSRISAKRDDNVDNED